MSSKQLQNLRIATPCPVGWQNMRGDNRVRFCELCQLHVYNISEMTSEEIFSTIARNEGRLCGRLYRRADGTVITKDCPVGLKALRRRVSRKAAAVVAAIVSLGTAALGQQSQSQGSDSSTQQVQIVRKKADTQHPAAAVSGVAIDINGALIPRVRVVLTNKATKEALTATTDDFGRFEISKLDAGQYTLNVQQVGFKDIVFKRLNITSDEPVELSLTLQPATTEVLVGVIALPLEPSLERKIGERVINGDTLRRLPF